MPGVLDQLLSAGGALGDNAVASVENLFGDLEDEAYQQRISDNQTIIKEPFRGDNTIGSPYDRGNQLYNEYTMDQLAEIKESLKNPEGKGSYYEIDFPQGFTKRGATIGTAEKRHPWIEASGGTIREDIKMDDFAYFERLVNGNKYLNTKKAFGKGGVPKEHDTEFYELALDGGFSEVYFKEDKTKEAKVKGMSTAVAELDNDQLDMAQVSMDVVKKAKEPEIIKLDTFEPEDGTATAQPVQKHMKTYSLKEQEEAANKLTEIDEATTGGSFSPKGAGDYEEILKDPVVKQLALDTYKDIEGEDISNMKERDQTAVLKTFASEQSNNITKMIKNATNKDSRKARRLSAFLKSYRASDLTPEQFAEGTLTTLTDPMTYATGGVGALAAKPLQLGLKKAITSGGVDAALTGLAQSVAEQTREKTAGNVDEISGKEIAKHMAIATAFGVGASAAMQKLGNKKLKDMTEVEKEILAEELVKADIPAEPDTKTFKKLSEANMDEKPKMEGMFGRAVERAKEVEESEAKTDIISELEADKVHPEPRIKRPQPQPEEKEKDKESIKEEDDITYKNRVKNLVTQRLLPETVEGSNREAPITSKGVGDIYEYQTQGRLSGQALAEKANRAAEMLSIEEGSTKKFTDDILEAHKLTQEAPKKGEHPLKRDLDTTELLIDSLNGRRYVLEDSGKPLTGKALAEHQSAIETLKAKRDELKTKMQDTDVETIARRKYGEQFEKDLDVETYDFTKASKQEVDGLIEDKLSTIKKDHDFVLNKKRLEGKVSKENEAEIDSVLTNIENELNTRIQETRKEKGDLTVSTTKLSQKENNLIKQIKVLQHDRANGMPDELYKAELADIFLKNEGLDYTKKLTEEKFTAKKARTQKLMEKLGIVLQDATPVKPKVEKKVSYADRKVLQKEDYKAKRPVTTQQQLDKEAKKNLWPVKDYDEVTRDAILKSTLERKTDVGAEELSWSKILNEAIEEGVITKRQAKDILTPRRIQGDIDNAIFNYNELRAENVARVAEDLNRARAQRDLGIELKEVEGGDIVSQTDAIDSVFSNIQIASAMTGDSGGFKAIGAYEGFTGDLRKQVAIDAMTEIGVNPRTLKRIEDKVDKVAKMALGNKAYTEGQMSVVRKLTKFFKDNNIKVSTKQLIELYKAINKAARNHGMGVLEDYSKQIQSAVKAGRIEPVLKFKNFDGKVESIKVHEPVTTKQKFMGKGTEVITTPTTKDTRSGKVAALLTQSVDAYIERAVRKAMGYKGTASVFDAFITGDKTKLPLVQKAIKKALQDINDKGGLAYILKQIDPEGKYKDADKIDFTKVKEKDLLATELTKSEIESPVGKIDTAESFLMSNTGMAINSMLEGSITNKRGLDALRESVRNAMRITEHTPERIAELKKAGLTEEQIGKRSDLEYSKLDKLAGEVLKASTKDDLKEIVKKYIPEGLTRKQTSNWTKAVGEIVRAQRRFMEQKSIYKGKRLFVNELGEDIYAGTKPLKQFFNELSIVDKEALGAELNTIDKAKEFVRRTSEMKESAPERKAMDAKNITEAQEHLINSKPENKAQILEAHAVKAKLEKGSADIPEGLHDRYTKNKKLRKDKQCAN